MSEEYNGWTNIEEGTMSEEYNGWTNIETWTVALWIGETYALIQCLEKALSSEFPARTLEREVYDYLMDRVYPVGLASDLLLRALAKVNWQEIIDAHKK